MFGLVYLALSLDYMVHLSLGNLEILLEVVSLVLVARIFFVFD